MARWLVSVAAALLFTTLAPAQPTRLQVGASAGMTAATQVHDAQQGLRANFETAYLLGPAVTVFLLRPVTPWSTARLDVGFTRKGHRRVGGDRPDVTEIIRLDMFSLRLGGEVGTSLGTNRWVYGVLGPRLDVLVGEESEFEVDGVRQGGRLTNVRYDEFVFGGIIGAGLRLDVGLGEAIQIEGLLDQDVSPAFSNEDLTVRGRAFMLHAGILF